MTDKERIDKLESIIEGQAKEIKRIMITIRPMYDKIHWCSGNFTSSNPELAKLLKKSNDRG